jgi:hypothetical protein
MPFIKTPVLFDLTQIVYNYKVLLYSVHVMNDYLKRTAVGSDKTDDRFEN